MRVALPHTLGRAEVRRRLREHSHEIADSFPGGMATVDTAWAGEDRMTMAISALGQHMTGAVDIEDAQVFVEVNLPPALSFIEPIVEGAMKKKATKLLEPPKA